MGEHAFLKHLREDHAEQKEVGGQLVGATKPEERERLRQQFHASLYPHMIGEEASLFRRLKNAEDDETRQAALEGLQEHHVGKIVLKELMELSTSSEVFRAKASLLDEMNRHHIEEEEDEVFAHLQRLCDDREMDTLFEAYESSEEKARSDASD
jgi:hemerythrin-like domain-containing protein